MHALKLLLVLVGGLAVPAPLPQDRSLPESSCGAELREAITQVGPGDESPGDGLRKQLDRAVVEFRFNRRKNAVEKLETLTRMLDGAPGGRLPADERQPTKVAVVALTQCFGAAPLPPLAQLTVRTFHLDPKAPDQRGAPAGSGVHVKVEGVHTARTAANGRATFAVPSGPIRVEALVPSTSWGEASADLRGGASGTVSIVLDDNKEVGENTDLVLAEAVDDVLPPGAESFTLKFVRDGATVPLTRLDSVELMNEDFNSDLNLDDQFELRANTIVARNLPALLRAIAKRTKDGDVVLSVQAHDERSGFTHANIVRFRINPR